MRCCRWTRRGVARPWRLSGFTLIEVLCSVTLGGAIVVGSAVVTAQSVSVRKAAGRLFTQRWQHFRVLDQFEADVRSALTWLDEPSRVITFPNEPDRLVEMISLSAVTDIGSWSRRRMPARITYILDRSNAESGHARLVREVVDLTQAERPPSARTLAERVVGCRVEAYNSAGTWDAAPGGRYGEMPLPIAVRLVCHWPDDSNTAEARTVIVRYAGSDDSG